MSKRTKVWGGKQLNASIFDIDVQKSKKEIVTFKRKMRMRMVVKNSH